MKNRERQRENRKENLIGKYRIDRVKDMTPYNAVRLMQGGKNNAIVFK